MGRDDGWEWPAAVVSYGSRTRIHCVQGIILAPEKYEALLHSVERDCKVLESFGIMDYSLLLGIHNIDQAIREKAEVSQ